MDLKKIKPKSQLSIAIGKNIDQGQPREGQDVNFRVRRCRPLSAPPGLAIRPSRVEQGILLAARWLIEYGQPSVAAYMLRDHGLDGCDLRKMEEQDIEILARLNITDGTHFILPNETSAGTDASEETL